MSDTNSYYFRLEFLIGKGINFDCDESSASLEHVKNDITIYQISPDDNGTIRKANRFALKGFGYSNEENVNNDACRIQECIYLAFAKERVGVIFTGLDICKTDEVNIFPYSEISISQTFNFEKLKHSLENVILSRWYFSEKEKISFRIMHSALLQYDYVSKFILLISAVEALVGTVQDDESSASLIGELFKKINDVDVFSDQEKQYIKNILGKQKKLSILKSCENYISKNIPNKIYHDKKANLFFRECYSIRSRLIHGKHPRPSFDDVTLLSPILEELVVDLMFSVS